MAEQQWVTLVGALGCYVTVVLVWLFACEIPAIGQMEHT